jgi:hypothetical protein
LPHIAQALNALGLGLGFDQGWQQQTGQNSNDCDNDEELDQRESYVEQSLRAEG